MGSDKLQVALVGAGRMSSTIDDEITSMDMWPSLKSQLPYSHAPCYKMVDDVEMVAVCDLEESKCKVFCDRWYVPRYYLNYQEMILREKPDIVSITTPATAHAEIAVFAMEHGVRGVYCEKPLCCSLTEADRIVECAQTHGVAFMLGAQRRHHLNFRKAREIIESGDIGELISVTSWIEGALLHSLSHLADNSLYLAGDVAPVSVYGVLAGLRSVKSMDEIEARRIAADLRFDEATRRFSGDPGCSTYTARLENGVFLIHLPAFMDVRWEAVGTNGYIRIVDNNDTLHLFKRHGRTYSFDPVALSPIPPASSHLALVRDLVRCVRTGARPLSNEIVARHGMEILIGTALSHLQGGQTVSLPLRDRNVYIPSY